MFGYVRICKPELKLCEYEAYKGVYCTLCKRLGKRYGTIARFSLSYDFTFVALVNMALADSCAGFRRGRCVYNPLKKCSYCGETAAVDVAADYAMLLLYYKLCDNVADERGFRRFGAKLLRALLSRAHKKAAARYPTEDEWVKNYLAKQQELETRAVSTDEAAEPTATLTGKLLAATATDDTARRVLDRLGYCIGRFVYLADAADDLEKDCKKGGFNPLMPLYEREGKAGVTAFVEASLTGTVAEAKAAYELLDVRRFDGILRNILWQGLPAVIQSLKKPKKEEKSR